eukprot:760974-Hanusia_phi.AAC.4
MAGMASAATFAHAFMQIRVAESKLQVLEDTIMEERNRSQRLLSVQKDLMERIETVLQENGMEEELLEIKKITTVALASPLDEICQEVCASLVDLEEGRESQVEDKSRTRTDSTRTGPRRLDLEINERFLEFIEARSEMKVVDKKVVLDAISKLRECFSEKHRRMYSTQATRIEHSINVIDAVFEEKNDIARKMKEAENSLKEQRRHIQELEHQLALQESRVREMESRNDNLTDELQQTEQDKSMLLSQ